MGSELENPPFSRLSRPLDALAYVAWNTLNAVLVGIAVTDPGAPGRNHADALTDAVVLGSYGLKEPSLTGRRLVLTPEILPGKVTLVRSHDAADGSLRLTPLTDITPPDVDTVRADTSTIVLRDGTTGRGAGIVVVLEAPAEAGARAARWLPELAAAAAAYLPERPGSPARLRFGLDEREEERRRWARELHDETLQQMGALQVLLTSTLRNTGWSAQEDRTPDALRMAVDLLNDQIVGLRHLITELRPMTLDELGLSAPLHALGRRTQELTGLAVGVDVSLRYADGELSTRLLPDIELAVYRVVQEALTNASRHSGATAARISVVEDDEEVWVEVSDNGTGVSGGPTAPGFGITGMQERALLAGGRLQILPRVVSDRGVKGGGTVVRLVVPATHREEEPATVPADPPVSATAQAPQT